MRCVKNGNEKSKSGKVSSSRRVVKDGGERETRKLREPHSHPTILSTISEGESERAGDVYNGRVRQVSVPV